MMVTKRDAEILEQIVRSIRGAFRPGVAVAQN
jgi:hypothetical protein